MKKLFNLIHESWILAQKNSGEEEEVSLKTLFLHAKEYSGLAGETLTQNIAVLRQVLLPISLKIIKNYDIAGNYSPTSSSKEVVKRWASFRENMGFPEKAVEDYFQSVEDDFWLIHPEKPFLQFKQASIGTKNDVPKLINTLSESSNKLRLFQSRSGKGKKKISFSEAARSLPHIICFDDTSVKPKNKTEDKKSESPGVGWLGKTGPIYAQGSNLLDTLLLNSILLDSSGKVMPPDHPIWEMDTSSFKERELISCPDNLGELLTLPSRYVLLDSDEEGVTGFRVLSGSFFESENAFCEPFTLWKSKKATKGKPVVFYPKTHSPSKQIWRDLSLLINPDDDGKQIYVPGIIRWLGFLRSARFIPKDYPVVLLAPSAQYGAQNASIAELSSQNLTIYPSIFTGDNTRWRRRINKELDNIGSMAWATGLLFRDIAETKVGEANDYLKKCQRTGEEEFYKRIDEPFRNWLLQLNPDSELMTDKALKTDQELVENWTKTARRVAYQILDQVIEGSLQKADVKSLLSHKSKDGDRNISVFNAKWSYLHQLNRIYPVDLDSQKKGGSDGETESQLKDHNR